MMRKVFLFAVIVLAVRAETTTMLWEAPGVEFVGTREWTDALQNKVYFNEKEHIFCGTICSRRVAECINSPPTEEDAVEACKTLLGKVARAPNQAIYNYTAKVDLESENESDNDDKSADSSNPSGAKRADSVSELRAVVRITELAFNFEEKPYSHFLKLDLEDVDLVTVSAGKTVKRELMDEGVVCDSYFFFTQRLSGEITKVYYRAAPSAVNDDIDAKKLNSSRVRQERCSTPERVGGRDAALRWSDTRATSLRLLPSHSACARRHPLRPPPLNARSTAHAESVRRAKPTAVKRVSNGGPAHRRSNVADGSESYAYYSQESDSSAHLARFASRIPAF